MIINAKGRHFQDLNKEIKDCLDYEITVDNCNGQRYIGAGLENRALRINGVPGNALCAYLNNCEVRVYGNAQDATCDTMNSGHVYIYGNSGDATGYAMRGGELYIQGAVGYRAGVHIKSYKENMPIIVIGKTAGNFLGEYQAGGIIIVLNTENNPYPVGDLIANGMHGGEIYIRSDNPALYAQSSRLIAAAAGKEDMERVYKYIAEFSSAFHYDVKELYHSAFIKITPNTKNPYKQLYVSN